MKLILTWKEIENFLKKELKKTKHIMTFGTIGSLNIEHDIDVIITKKPSSPSSKFFKEVHELFDYVDNFLKNNFNFNVVKFSRLSDEFIIKNNIGSKNKIFFHSMVYISFPEIEKDWIWGIFPDENMKKIIKENYKCLIGNVEDLFLPEFMKQNYCDNIFTYLYLNDFFHSGFNEREILEIMNNLFDYLYRKRLGLKYEFVKNLKQIREKYYKLCDIADELNKNKE